VWLRRWLLYRAQIIASVDLPKTTFAASKGVNNPGLLLVRKFSRQERKRADLGIVDTSYRLFMAAPQTAGIDKRAKPLLQRHADGQLRTDSNGNPMIDDEISAVAAAFDAWRHTPFDG